MGILNKIGTAMNAFLTAFNDPETFNEKKAQDIDRYALAWAFYRNLLLSGEHKDREAFLSSRQLYKYTKLIFNPVPNIVDFYVDNIWQGGGHPEYPNLITPIEHADNAAIFPAVGQIDQWANWRSQQDKVKRYAATSGDVLVEGIDDAERQKITSRCWWGKYVKDIELNDSGDVQGYTLEYPVYDRATKATVNYKKIVTKESYSYFRNDVAFTPEGKTAPVEPNDYGFVFAVLIKHTDDGGTRGRAAFNEYDKVLHTNSLACDLHDNIHMEIHSGKFVFVDDPSVYIPLTGASKNADGTINENDPRLDRVLIAMKAGGSVADMSGTVKLADAESYLKYLILSFGDDYPELEYRQIIKQNAQLSGIALERLLTPAQNRLDAVAGNYDIQLIKLRQMQLAVGGLRYNGGTWLKGSKQRDVFAPFNLDSYEKGHLDFYLKRSLLIEPSEDELVDLQGRKFDNANKADFVPVNEKFKIAGYNDDQTMKMIEQRAKEDPLFAQAYGMAQPPNQVNG